MKNTNNNKAELYITIFTLVSILFWLYAAGSKAYNFNKWKSDMSNQIFNEDMATILSYAVPTLEIIIAAILVFKVSRLLGMALSLLLMLGFTTYVGLAVLKVYDHTPCNCAGILGAHTSWETNFIFNLIVTAVSASIFIFTYKKRRKEENGMHNNVLHAPLTA